MEEVRGEFFTWNELKESFLKDFKFLSQDELLVEAYKQIKNFLQPTDNNIAVESQPSRQNAMCQWKPQKGEVFNGNLNIQKLPNQLRQYLKFKHQKKNTPKY